METNIIFLIFQLAVLIFSVMIHEISHGYVAEYLGDPTARDAGRLTLNPVKHIDPIGSIILPAILSLTNSPILFGWAKPVPYNPNNLHKDFKYGSLKVALAGPASNFFMLVVFGLLARAGAPFISWNLVGLFGFIAFLNAFLGVLNLIPIPPLDGSKILSTLLPQYADSFERIGFSGIFLLIIFILLFGSFISYVSNYLFLLVAGENTFRQMINVLNLFYGT